jgi:hypothetical protein
MKSRNIFFSSPSSTEILSSSEIVGIVTLLEPHVQCSTELSRVYIGTISVTYLARRRLSLLYRCFAFIEVEAIQGMQPFWKHDVYLMIYPRCHGRQIGVHFQASPKPNQK